MSELAVVTESLQKTFGSRHVLRGLNLTISRGAVYGLLGANGVGKSTVMNLLAGLLKPTEGQALVFGRNPTVRRDLASEQIAYVDQGKTLCNHLTVGRMVQLAEGLSSRWSKSLADKYVRVEHDRQVNTLSHGQRAQLAFGLAAARRAPLLLLDEPTANLDPIAVQIMLRGLIEDCVEEGSTVLLCSHELEEISQVCSQVGFLKSGCLQYHVSLEALESNYRIITSVQDQVSRMTVPNAIVARAENGIGRYLVTGDARSTAAHLASEGVQVLDIQPLSLKMLYFECLAEDGAQGR